MKQAKSDEAARTCVVIHNCRTENLFSLTGQQTEMVTLQLTPGTVCKICMACCKLCSLLHQRKIPQIRTTVGKEELTEKSYSSRGPQKKLKGLD